MKGGDEEGQVNCIATDNTSDLVFAGLDNGLIEVIDIKTNSIVKSFKGHERVANIQTNCTISSNKFFTVGNDGKLKAWDIRKYECLNEVLAHKAKFGDAGLALCGLPSMNIIATGILLLYIRWC